MRRTIGCLLSLSLVAICGGACGEPQFYSPSALHVVFMPLAGAIDVDPASSLHVFFSSALDVGSVNADSVYLQPAKQDITSCDPGAIECFECTAWDDVKVALDLSVSSVSSAGGPTSKVTIKPKQPLEKIFYYRLTITTAVQGLTVGPLEDMNIPASCRKGVGAQETFYTIK